MSIIILFINTLPLHFARSPKTYRQSIKIEHENLNFVWQSESSNTSPKKTRELTVRVDIHSQLSAPVGSLYHMLKKLVLHPPPYLICPRLYYYSGCQFLKLLQINSSKNWKFIWEKNFKHVIQKRRSFYSEQLRDFCNRRDWECLVETIFLHKSFQNFGLVFFLLLFFSCTRKRNKTEMWKKLETIWQKLVRWENAM